jgi:uncharacterized protein (TIGR03437 family)
MRSQLGALAVCVLVGPPAWPQSTALDYLRQQADQFQKTVDVYTLADAAGNHFAARGRINSRGGEPFVPPMDEISSAADCPRASCITASFLSRGDNWGGWYFLNGVLGPRDRQPNLNWGTEPAAGYDLSGASALRFYARGATGSERVEFFAFGVGNTNGPSMPYPDSAKKLFIEVTLQTVWTKYEIPIPPATDLRYVLGGFGWVASADKNPSDITFYLADIGFVKERPTDDRFLVSYETIKSANPFDLVQRNTAYVYDNALAAIAFAAAGDLPRARYILNAMAAAMGRDRFFTDNRLRNAYQGGDLLLPPGWRPNNREGTVRMPGWYDSGRTTWFEDEFHVSTATGNVAWAMIAFLYFYEQTREELYLRKAGELGDWVLTHTWDDRGSGGFTGGYDGWENGAVSGAGAMTCPSGVFVNGQCKRLYKSSEHAIDLYSAFSRLHAAQPDVKWRRAAQHAKRFLLSMWDPVGGKFWTGTAEDGVTTFKDVIPLDVQAWALSALGAEAAGYLRALQFIEENHATSLGYGFKQNGGNSCGDTTWYEGTGQVAVAYTHVGDSARSMRVIENIRKAQMPSGALPATDADCVNTGFTLNSGDPWLYFRRAHIAPVAWLSLAENRVNPFRPDIYAPPGPIISISRGHLDFGDHAVGNTSSSAAVTVSNHGTSALVLSGVVISSGDRGDFVQTNNCVGSMPPGSSCDINLVFKPSAVGVRRAVLTLSSDGPGSPDTVELVGQGSGASTPTVVIQTLSPFGSSPGLVSGMVKGVDPRDVKIAALIFVSGLGYYTKPTCAATSTVPRADGSFSIQLTTGGVDHLMTRLALLVVPAAAQVPCYTGVAGVPPELSRVAVASLIVDRPNPGEREVTFAGLKWRVKASPVPVGPGPNFFSDSPENVFVDSSGRLHLKLKRVNGNWVCTEVITRIAVGYGSYKLTLASPPNLFDNVVFGAFTWADGQNNNAEIDALEIGFGRPGDPTNAQNVVQPFTRPGNLHRFTIPNTSPTTHFLNWSPATVSFQSYVGVDGGGTRFNDWSYTGPIPQPEQGETNFRLNLWLNGPGPADGAEQEVIISDFAFTPVSVARDPELERIANGATFQPGLSPGALYTIFGQDLALSEMQAATAPLPTVLGGVRVEIDGVNTPLLYAGPNQINGQLPDTLGIGQSTVRVHVHDKTSEPLSFIVSEASPGQFLSFGNNCLAVNQDGTLNGTDNPAKQGSAISAYLTGIGPVDNPVRSGFPTPLSPLSHALLPSTATIGFRPARVLFMGLAPSLIGVGQSNIEIPNDLESGLHAVVLTIGGAPSNSCRLSVGDRLPTVRPTITSVEPTSGPSVGGTLVMIRGANFAPGAVVRFGSAPAAGVAVVNSSLIRATSPPGAGIVSLTVENPDGQVAAVADVFTYLDRRLILISVAPSSGPQAGGTVVTISGENIVAGATVKFGNAPATAVNVLSATSIQATTPPGTGTVDVTVTNPSGETATSTNAFRYLGPAPIVTGMSPASGPAGGGTLVVFTGSGFAPEAKVIWNGVSLPNVTVVNSNTIQVPSPPGSPQSSIRPSIVNPDGQSALSPTMFSYVALVLLTIAPSSGPQSGGTVVTISGENIVAGATVKFGNAPATAVNVLSVTSIRATTPPGTGTVDVTVTNPSGETALLSNGFRYVATPTISSVDPVIGPPAGGTLVTVTGTNFQNGATVQFGSVAATSVVFVSVTTLRAAAPAGTGTVALSVTNPDGQSVALPNAFTYGTPLPPSLTASLQACRVAGTLIGGQSPDNYRIVVWARTNMFYIQPCDTERTQTIRADRTWGPIDSHSGEIWVLLVRNGYVPSPTTSSLPAVDGVNVFAIVGPVGTLNGCDVARCPAR